MFTKLPFKRTVHLGLTALAGLLAVPLMADDEIFYLPDMEVELFDSEKLEFGKRTEVDQEAMVNALVRVASDFDMANGKVDADLRSNSLGIAGRIDPESKMFKDTLKQLEQNGKAFGANNTSKSRLVYAIYTGVRLLLDKAYEDNEDNKICAAYSIDVALRLDPESKYAKKLRELQDELKADDVEVDWAKLKGQGIIPGGPGPGPDSGRMEVRKEDMPTGNGEAFASRQSSVIGLVVVTLPGGKHAGAGREIIATALPEDVKDIQIKIDQPVGDMMGNSLKSIRDYLRILHGGTERVPKAGHVVNIVFQDRDQPVDGPSAGMAMFLMLDALFSGEAVDPNFACTGGITPNGKCTKIGGVAAKIRGATNKHCNIVGVPEGNAGGVADILVLKGIEPLLDIQVFTMKDAKEAKAIALQEKSPEVLEVLDDFNKVAKVIKDDGAGMLSNSQVQKKLEAVLEKMPNHMSAKLLLEQAKGNAPERLSAGGSFHEIDSRASGAFSRAQMMVFRGKFTDGKAARDDAAEAIADLEEIQDKVDERFADYIKAKLAVCRVLEAGIQDGEEEFIKELRTKWEAAQTIAQKLSTDPELREEIMG